MGSLSSVSCLMHLIEGKLPEISEVTVEMREAWEGMVGTRMERWSKSKRDWKRNIEFLSTETCPSLYFPWHQILNWYRIGFSEVFWLANWLSEWMNECMRRKGKEEEILEILLLVSFYVYTNTFLHFDINMAITRDRVLLAFCRNALWSG